jgi:hypothetical protein
MVTLSTCAAFVYRSTRVRQAARVACHLKNAGVPTRAHPVVFVYGTASSPTRWADMFNRLLADPEIRTDTSSGSSSTTPATPSCRRALPARSRGRSRGAARTRPRTARGRASASHRDTRPRRPAPSRPSRGRTLCVCARSMEASGSPNGSPSVPIIGTSSGLHNHRRRCPSQPCPGYHRRTIHDQPDAERGTGDRPGGQA